MSSPPTSKLPIPKSWDEFEDIVTDVLRLRWCAPNVTRNGRNGQGQHGVDVYAFVPRLEGYAGAQCKNRDAQFSTTDIDKLVGDAEAFVPPLREFLITTTLPRDVAVQQHVRTLNVTRHAAGKFFVEILFWDDLSLELSGDPNLLAKHFPNWAGLTARDKEPELHVGWFINDALCTQATVRGLSPYCRDFIGVLDPYSEDELAYLRADHAADAALAEAFNRTADALVGDPEVQHRWRANHAGSAFADGTRLAIAVAAERAPAQDVVVTLELDADFDVFRGDARPRDQPFDLPEHPKLASEHRYGSVADSALAAVGVGTRYEGMFGTGHLRALLLDYDRGQLVSRLRIDDRRVTIRVPRLAPRQPIAFADDDTRIVVAPWCEAGTHTVRWRADAANRNAAQTGELTLVVEANAHSVGRRRQSYVGPPLDLRSVRVKSGEPDDDVNT